MFFKKGGTERPILRGVLLHSERATPAFNTHAFELKIAWKEVSEVTETHVRGIT